ncbi:MAG: septum formation initiator family protein [Proteobacteria bacterium]|nr:septum formation initiator family protein [Pseudomonadota bacterium]
MVTIKQIVSVSAASIILIAMMGLILFSDKGFMDMKRLQNVKITIASRNAEVETENKELYRKINRLKSDPAYIENIARQEMGMVGVDDVVLKFQEKPRRK